jgi:hypothetical protein
MTLTELRLGLSPFESRGQRRLKFSQVFFSILTILLVVLAARFTEYLHRQGAAVKSFLRHEDGDQEGGHPLPEGASVAYPLAAR